MEIIKAVFDKNVIKVGDTLKIDEYQGDGQDSELIWYGQVLTVLEDSIEVTYIDGDGELHIDKISIDDVLEELFIIEVVG